MLGNYVHAKIVRVQTQVSTMLSATCKTIWIASAVLLHCLNGSSALYFRHSGFVGVGVESFRYVDVCVFRTTWARSRLRCALACVERMQCEVFGYEFDGTREPICSLLTTNDPYMCEEQQSVAMNDTMQYYRRNRAHVSTVEPTCKYTFISHIIWPT